jgi:hypothetical protein
MQGNSNSRLDGRATLTLGLKVPPRGRPAPKPTFVKGAVAKPKRPSDWTGPDAGPTDHFWFNWVAGRRAPRRRFATEQEAREEAARLRTLGLHARTYEARVLEQIP